MNEDLDPMQIVKRLKGEILTLREEIAFLKVCARVVFVYQLVLWRVRVRVCNRVSGEIR